MSIDKHIHIVSFDVPYPPNYGGVIDVFYRIVALHKLGFKITLHCFEYGRGKHDELNKFTEQVHYYPRSNRFFSLFGRKPYIVKSRSTEELFKNLKKNNYPILFEGLHSTYFIGEEELNKRVKLVRTHNVEHDYYLALASSSIGWKKIFFNREAKKLKQFEHELKNASALLAIQKHDVEHFKKWNNNVHLLPASLPLESTFNYKETKPYCLFHGNLSVPENDYSAIWLLENVVNICPNVSFVIAGKNPSETLIQKCKATGVELVSNPSEQKMNDLISTARIHLLHTDQSTGLKLKLLNALMANGAVIVNDKMVEGTDLGPLCFIAKKSDEYVSYIQKHLNTPINQEEVEKRKAFILNEFDTVKNCRLITDLCGYLN